MMFFKLLKKLKPKFKVYMIDLIGMGRSSRLHWRCTNVEETERVFVESLECWRKAMGIKLFDLAGHSFGGYVSSLYSLKHSNSV